MRRVGSRGIYFMAKDAGVDLALVYGGSKGRFGLAPLDAKETIDGYARLYILFLKGLMIKRFEHVLDCAHT